MASGCPVLVILLHELKEAPPLAAKSSPSMKGLLLALHGTTIWPSALKQPSRKRELH